MRENTSSRRSSHRVAASQCCQRGRDGVGSISDHLRHLEQASCSGLFILQHRMLCLITYVAVAQRWSLMKSHLLSQNPF
jgi:hypothetical protein